MPGTVHDEASALPSSGSGITIYDDHFPIGQASFHQTDEAYASWSDPSNVVRIVDIDWEYGGETGLVDRNAYVFGGIANYTDAHDFRGDHVHLQPRNAHGNYGDVGNSDDYATAYAMGVAAQGYPDFSQEESYDDISAGI